MRNVCELIRTHLTEPHSVKEVGPPNGRKTQLKRTRRAPAKLSRTEPKRLCGEWHS